MRLQLAKVAWDNPRTVSGYKRLARRRTIQLVSLSVPFLLAVGCLGLGKFPDGVVAFLVIIIGSLPWLPWVAITYLRRLRVEAILRSYPWRELPCRHVPYVTGSPSTILVRFQEDFTATLRIVPFPVNLAERENDQPDRIWFAGDPRFGGVVSPVGGHYPVRVVPDKVVPDGWVGGDDGLARRVGLVRRNGKATQT
ncbi:hypothetical protein AMK16_04840 [Streptomyces sp. CB00455]|uniref:hypothetical protein n=1 Tax=Streptomyces sp. CB00455 TaxID=1703927 RepID=UPI00093B3602|nr:hypothetical protein [Streptomyces sp. CB00455]OKK22461.1 hypothetical protein AMK16_04840 [Streptomyces sp. CB00455]